MGIVCDSGYMGSYFNFITIYMEIFYSQPLPLGIKSWVSGSYFFSRNSLFPEVIFLTL